MKSQIRDNSRQKENSKNQFWIVDLVFLILLIGGIFAWKYLNINKEDSNIIRLNNIYKIDNAESIGLPIIDTSNTFIYFQSKKSISKYNLYTRKLDVIGNIDDEFIFTLVKDKILTCRWENYLIDEPDQIATKIWLEDLNGHIINEFETSKTIRPITCNKKSLVGIDNYPNSLGRFYSVDLAENEIKEIEYVEKDNEDKKVEILTLDDKTQISIKDKTFLIDYPNVFRDALIVKQKNGLNLALLDKSEGIWVAY